jgi:hypothetical protein
MRERVNFFEQACTMGKHTTGLCFFERLCIACSAGQHGKMSSSPIATNASEFSELENFLAEED